MVVAGKRKARFKKESKRRPGREKGRGRERERESVTAGELRQSIRLPGPKELEPGFAE